MTRTALFLTVILALPAFGIGASAATAQEPIIITLLPQAVIDDTLVTLGQVAKLRGGSDPLRKRLERLDVAEFKLGTTQVTVLHDQVRFRLMLAGLEATEFQLGGAQRALIQESAEPATLRKILAAAEQALRAKYAGAEAEMVLTANKGVNVPTVQLRPGERVQFEGKVNVREDNGDRARIDVALRVGGKTREVVPVFFAIATAELAPSNSSQDKPGVRPALYTVQGPAARDFFIKTGDNVKIVATIGSARIEATGEATQNGRVGDVIRVRNVESNRTVHGRIDASGMILVDY